MRDLLGGGVIALGVVMLWVRRRHGSHNILADALYDMWKAASPGDVDSYLLVGGIVGLLLGTAVLIWF